MSGNLNAESQRTAQGRPGELSSANLCAPLLLCVRRLFLRGKHKSRSLFGREIVNWFSGFGPRVSDFHVSTGGCLYTVARKFVNIPRTMSMDDILLDAEGKMSKTEQG